MLKKPDHYIVTTPRLLQEVFGKVVDAVNLNTEAVKLLADIAKNNTLSIRALTQAAISVAEPPIDLPVEPPTTVAEAVPEEAVKVEPEMENKNETE